MPYFIAAYKEGSADIDLPGEETAVAWYRTTPVDAGPDGGKRHPVRLDSHEYRLKTLDTQWGPGGGGSAARGARDVISVVALTTGARQLTVAIGQRVWYFETNRKSRASYFEVPFDSSIVGPVRVTLGDKAVDGPPIVNECCHGEVRFLVSPHLSSTANFQEQVIFNHVAIKI